MLNRFLFKKIDNAPLIVFRVAFGLLIFLESIGAIFTGWVRRTLIAPDFTFNFIGFDFLQPLPGNWMYAYFALMGLFGFLVMIGYKYRWSLAGFTVMWTCVYLMQKASYNNHYYLLILLCLLMLVQPANRYLSVDVRQHPDKKAIAMPQWCSLLMILQVWIVYTYAAIAKLYPDWLDVTVVENLMAGKRNYPVIGALLQTHVMHISIAYFGILFDLLVVPMLLWRPTRKLAFFASIFFHLFNSVVFQIGIFPYMSLAFILFFFEPETIRTMFLRKKPLYTKNEVEIPGNRRLILGVGIVYFAVQIALPLRHWFIKDNVLWTEEAHRMSWRMMLRTKYGHITFKVVDKNTGATHIVNPRKRLSVKQKGIIATHPDVIWQFVQRLKREYKEKGQEVAIYVTGKMSVNGRKLKPFIDPDVDLAGEKWHYVKHHEWILPSELH
ncbi:MAG: HTTM domain-containing protein [Bacteroidota bacterium]